MKIEVTKFKMEDAAELEQNGEDESASTFKLEDFREAASRPCSYTIRINGRIAAIAGIIEYWKNRGEAWFMPQKKITKGEFLALHRTVKRFLDVVPVRRVEAVVCSTYGKGARWAEMLGFELEAETMKSYSASGKDYSLYARIK